MSDADIKTITATALAIRLPISYIDEDAEASITDALAAMNTDARGGAPMLGAFERNAAWQEAVLAISQATRSKHSVTIHVSEAAATALRDDLHYFATLRDSKTTRTMISAENARKCRAARDRITQQLGGKQ